MSCRRTGGGRARGTGCRMGACALWALGVLAWPVLAFAAAPKMRFERIVAVVDKDVITEGELLAEARLALVMREGDAAASVPLSDDYLHTFTDHLIGQVLVAQEARRMGAEGASDVEVETRLTALQAHFPGREAYLKFIDLLTMDIAGVRAVMARDVQNDRYVAQRLRTRLLAHAAREVPQPQDVQQVNALRDWLAELRHGAQVRVLGDGGMLHLEQRK